MEYTTKMPYKEELETIEDKLRYTDFKRQANEERKTLLKDRNVRNEDIIEIAQKVDIKLIEIKEHLANYLALHCYNKIFKGKETVETYRKEYKTQKAIEELDFESNIMTTVSLVPDGIVSIDTMLAYLLTEYTGNIKKFTFRELGVEKCETIYYTVKMELQEVLQSIICDIIKIELQKNNRYFLSSQEDIEIISRMLYEDIRAISRVDYLFLVDSVLTVGNYNRKTLRDIVSNIEMKTYKIF